MTMAKDEEGKVGVEVPSALARGAREKEVAKRIVLDWLDASKVKPPSPYSMSLINDIAWAIRAETERCAKIADDEADKIMAVANQEDDEGEYGDVELYEEFECQACVASSIAELIRKPSSERSAERAAPPYQATPMTREDGE